MKVTHHQYGGGLQFGAVTPSAQRTHIIIIALLTHNTGFGPGFSDSDWQDLSHDQSDLAL